MAKTATARHDQCLEFIEIIRKEEKSLPPQIDAKVRHYFNAAFQNLTISEAKQTQVSLQDTRQLLQTIVEGTKKTIDVMDRKFEQFLQLQRVPVYTSHNRPLSIDTVTTTDKKSPLITEKHTGRNSLPDGFKCGLPSRIMNTASKEAYSSLEP